MKIYQFPAIPQTKGPEKQSGPKNGEADFASVLKDASAKSRNAGAGGIISIENQRALRLPPSMDLGLAGRLINRLETDIKSASPEMLKSVHNLEGLIYVYNKNGG